MKIWEKNKPTREGCLRKLCETDIEPSALAINPKHKGALEYKGELYLTLGNLAGAEALLARGDSVVIVDEMNDYYDVTMKEGNLQRLKDDHYPGDLGFDPLGADSESMRNAEITNGVL